MHMMKTSRARQKLESSRIEDKRLADLNVYPALA